MNDAINHDCLRRARVSETGSRTKASAERRADFEHSDADDDRSNRARRLCRRGGVRDSRRGDGSNRGGRRHAPYPAPARHPWQIEVTAGNRAGTEASSPPAPARRRASSTRRSRFPPSSHASPPSTARNPKTGPVKHLGSLFDFACGSGSLPLNVRPQLKKQGGTIGKSTARRKTSPPIISPAGTCCCTG
jgi:hypothetical protein